MGKQRKQSAGGAGERYFFLKITQNVFLLLLIPYLFIYESRIRQYTETKLLFFSGLFLLVPGKMPRIYLLVCLGVILNSYVRHHGMLVPLLTYVTAAINSSSLTGLTAEKTSPVHERSESQSHI